MIRAFRAFHHRDLLFLNYRFVTISLSGEIRYSSYPSVPRRDIFFRRRSSRGGFIDKSAFSIRFVLFSCLTRLFLAKLERDNVRGIARSFRGRLNVKADDILLVCDYVLNAVARCISRDA